MTVDVSRSGILLAFAEPVGFAADHRLVVSLDLIDGEFHALARVTRVERGADFRTYVATEFVNLDTVDYDELTDQISRLDECACAETDALLRAGATAVDITAEGLTVEGPNSI